MVGSYSWVLHVCHMGNMHAVHMWPLEEKGAGVYRSDTCCPKSYVDKLWELLALPVCFLLIA